ncbi:MAG TPA: amidase [Solirubrobacteraceae bacterium]|jgi:amidase|nr:amidase [Solirubrobacteraceae bacterium]
MTTTNPTTDLTQHGAVEQAALVRSGELSARELVEAALTQIDRTNRRINAFVAVRAERALAEADTIRAGDQRPLCGVPIACKDLLGATAELPTTHGSAAFGDWVADHDTAHVRHLREAGAIVVGKTNTPELGLRPVTENHRFGPTRNPWRTTLSAGGSSGGSAAAVAAGMVGLADGSDLGGSLRIPAACCGVIALKPSRGRVSIGPDFGDIAGGVPVDGPIARTALDIAVALDAMSGYEAGDHHWIGPPARSFAAAAENPCDRVTIRLANCAPLGVPVDEQPMAAAQLASAALADLGHALDEGTPDWDDETFPSAWSTFATGALQHLVRVVQRLHGRPVDREQLEPATRAWILDSAPVTLIDYLEAREELIAFSRRVMRSWPADSVLLTPTLTRLPAPVGGIRSRGGVTDDAVRFSALVRIWNVTGQPAISLPLHQTPDGIPVGVQLIAPPGREDLLIGLAAQLEQSVGWRPQPSP